MISDRLLAVLCKLHYAANTIAPPNTLPPEILLTVFSYLCPGAHRDWDAEPMPPYASLLAVTRVCHRWREIAVSATELWTRIILTGPQSIDRGIFVAQPCVRRSGVQPLDFYCATRFSKLVKAEELIPDRLRLRGVVYGGADRFSKDELSKFLLPATYLERLEIRANESFSLPVLASDTAPHLRELTISKCTLWPNNRFGSLISLVLLSQKDIDANIYSLLDTLRCSPHLEEFIVERENRTRTQPQEPPEQYTLPIPLHSLKRLHVCRLLAGTTQRLLRALDLVPNGIFMRFTNVSADLGAILPEAITPELSPRAVAKLEVVYPPMCGVILHAANGVAHTRLAYRHHPTRGEFLRWIMGKPFEGYSLKELWLHIDRKHNYEVPPPHVLRDLETLVIETDPTDEFDSTFFLMLSPNEDGVPSPLLSTLQLRNVSDVKILGDILKTRSDAGFRLKMLRVRWTYGLEEKMAPIAQFVEKIELHRVTDTISRGLELPKECMTKSRGWEPWVRNFTGEMEYELGRWGVVELW